MWGSAELWPLLLCGWRRCQPPGADTINVVQKTRYWWDNTVYYEYGPFRDADHCTGFAKSNPQLSELFVRNEAVCSADAGSPWHLNAPVNIL